MPLRPGDDERSRLAQAEIEQEIEVFVPCRIHARRTAGVPDARQTWGLLKAHWPFLVVPLWPVNLIAPYCTVFRLSGCCAIEQLMRKLSTPPLKKLQVQRSRSDITLEERAILTDLDEAVASSSLMARCA